MSESRLKKRKVEFIESYWTGGEFGSDYQWNDNHGELIRCKDCKWFSEKGFCKHPNGGAGNIRSENWYCADGEKDEGQMKRPKETFWDSMSEAELIEPMHRFQD